MQTLVQMTVNGKVMPVNVDPRTLLVQVSRDDLGLTGTHVGCDTVQCGACTPGMVMSAIRKPATRHGRLRGEGRRFAMNLISAISFGGASVNGGGEGDDGGERFIEFLRRLIQGRRRPVVVIGQAHHAQGEDGQRARASGTRAPRVDGQRAESDPGVLQKASLSICRDIRESSNFCPAWHVNIPTTNALVMAIKFRTSRGQTR